MPTLFFVLDVSLRRYDALRDPTSPIRESVREQHRKTLRQALHVWLDQYPEDFHEPPNYPCLSQLEGFSARVMPDSELDQKVRRKGRELRGKGQQASVASAASSSSFFPSSPSERGPASLKSSPLINQLLSASPHGPAGAAAAAAAANADFSVKSPPSSSVSTSTFSHPASTVGTKG